MRSVVLALVLALAAVVPAGATYPGRDGRIAVVAGGGCSGHYGEPCNALAFTSILAVSPLGHGAADVIRCPGPKCVVPGFGPPAAYSPDGGRLAVAVAPSTTTPVQVAILRSDGSELRRVPVPGLASIAGLAWLPDGRRVAVFAYSGRVDQTGRVLVIGADGAGAREMAWRPKGQRAWSSVGSVAISHFRGIYVWDRATRVRRLLLANGRRFTYGPPDWSPDGRRLVVVRRDLRTSLQTIVTAAAGGHRRVVVRGVGQTFGRVAWSPSGRRIAFTTGEWDGDSAVFTVRTDGAGLRRIFRLASLTSGLGIDGHMWEGLSWQPLRR
jgi:WD40 repeat protein